MKRRQFMRAVAAVPAGSALLAQQPVGGTGSASRTQTEGVAVLEVTAPDVAALPIPRFFTAGQFSTLRKLSEILVPPLNGNPGAIEAGVPEFLDFQVGASSSERQGLYRSGLDELDDLARKKFQAGFAALSNSQVDVLIRPMFRAMPENRSVIPAGPFLNIVHEDVRTATMNSREWAQVAEAAGRRTRAGVYWSRVDPTALR